MRSPFRTAARPAPRPSLRTQAPMAFAPVPTRSRRIASLSTACAMVIGVGAGTAMFVDYLADRAMARAADPAPASQEQHVRLASDSSVASDAQADTGAEPLEVRPPEIAIAPMPIAAPSENAIEIPLDDPTAKPILQLDQIETAALEETPDAAVDAVALEEDIPAVELDEATEEAVLPEPEIKPKKIKPAAKKTAKAEQETTSLAALPGVDIGGLAGNPSGKTTGTGRTVRISKAVNMRANGKKGAQVLGVVPAGSSVSLYGCDQWCEISYKGRRGFVYKSFVGGGNARVTTTKAAAKSPVKPTLAADAAESKRTLSSRAQ